MTTKKITETYPSHYRQPLQSQRAPFVTEMGKLQCGTELKRVEILLWKEKNMMGNSKTQRFREKHIILACCSFFVKIFGKNSGEFPVDRVS